MIQIDREVELTCNAPSVPSTSKKEVHQQLEDLKAEWKHLNETMKLKKVRLEQVGFTTKSLFVVELTHKLVCIFRLKRLSNL